MGSIMRFNKIGFRISVHS